MIAAIVALAGAALASASPAPVSADEIFVLAQRAWERRVVPPYESFQVDCTHTFVDPDCSPGERIAFVVSADGRTVASVAGSNPPKVVMRDGYITGPVGMPLGFYRYVGPQGAVATPPPNLAPDPLRVIGTVTANAHVYDVTLVGIDTVSGRACYHLVLRPQLDPVRYALRDLWIDQASHEVIALNYERPSDGKRPRVLVRYEFAPVGPSHVWTIVHISARAWYVGRPRAVESVSEDLHDIAFPSAPP